MIKIEKLQKEINRYLSIIRYYVEQENNCDRFDINKYCEDIFCELLNIIYKINLTNLNKIKVNFPAIDLADKEEGICFQVTSTLSRKKIADTIDKYTELKLYNEYETLYILLLGNKGNYKKFDTIKEVDFSAEKNIIGFKELTKYINGLSVKRLTKVLNFLESHVDINTGKVSFFNNILDENPVYPKTFDNYLRYLNINDEEDITIVKNSYNIFIEELCELDEDTRTVIYAILKKRIHLSGIQSDVPFNSNEIYTFLRIEKELLWEKLEILYHKKWFDPKGETYEEYDCLCHYINDIEIFSDLIAFCESEGKPLDEIIVKLDFSCFD